MTKFQFVTTRGMRVIGVTTSLAVVTGIALTPAALASSTPREQISAAVAAGNARHYVKIISINTAPSESQTIATMAGPGMGIQVLTSSAAGISEHMTVEYVNHSLYVKASLGFLRGTFGLSSGTATPLINKWAVVPITNSAYRTVFSGVTITSAMSFVASPGRVTAGLPTVRDGVRVKLFHIAIPKSSTSPAGTETLYVALSGPPLPVEEDLAGGGYTSKIKFSQWGKHFSLSAPATSLQVP